MRVVFLCQQHYELRRVYFMCTCLLHTRKEKSRVSALHSNFFFWSASCICSFSILHSCWSNFCHSLEESGGKLPNSTLGTQGQDVPATYLALLNHLLVQTSPLSYLLILVSAKLLDCSKTSLSAKQHTRMWILPLKAPFSKYLGLHLGHDYLNMVATGWNKDFN